MRVAGSLVLGGLLAVAGLSWCADGAMAGARWYPPSYDDEGYSPPAGYLPPPVSYYQYAPRRPVVVYDPPPVVWVPRRYRFVADAGSVATSPRLGERFANFARHTRLTRLTIVRHPKFVGPKGMVLVAPAPEEALSCRPGDDGA